jgi:hypothetical protein
MKIRVTFKNSEELIKILGVPLYEFINKGAQVKVDAKNEYLHIYITADDAVTERVKLNIT